MRPWPVIVVAAALLSPAAPATAAPAAPAEPGPRDRIAVTAASGYALDGSAATGSVAVNDRAFDYRTEKVNGRLALPGPSGGTAVVDLRLTLGLFGLTGTFTVDDPAAGVRVSARVGGGVTVPEDGTVRWQGLGTVTRGTSAKLEKVGFTLNDLQPDPGGHAIRIRHAGQDRKAILRLPDDYDGTPRPVLFHFPGLLEFPWMAELFGRMSDYAQTRGFIMITPEHHGIAWQTVPGAPSTGDPDVDDPGYVERLQDLVTERYNADPRRLYASGFSNGGYFTSRLACSNTRFAAFAPVSGQLRSPETCRPGRAVPIVLIHGDGDSVVPYEEAPPSAAFWAKNNGCGETPAETALPDLAPEDNTTVARIAYSCPSGGPVELYRIRGGGHNWPGGTPFLGPFLGGTTYDIDANAVIWDFVSAHRLP